MCLTLSPLPSHSRHSKQRWFCTMPIFCKLSCVQSFSFRAYHKIQECLGTWPLNHNSWAQPALSPSRLERSQITANWKTAIGSKSPSYTILSNGVGQKIAASDLGSLLPQLVDRPILVASRDNDLVRNQLYEKRFFWESKWIKFQKKFKKFNKKNKEYTVF